MGKNRTARRRPLPDPEAVLSGRLRPDPYQLLELIRDANPTGADLPEAEAEARYALKHRLQSLLLRRFPERVGLRPEPGQPGLVLIEYEGRGACHALLSELDEDARAFAQRSIDVGDLGGGPGDDLGGDATGAQAATHAPLGRGAVASARGVAEHLPPGRGAPGGAALIEARVAEGLLLLREYDYEGARACFEEALARSGGAPRPARALLSLLVDELALDGEALEARAALSAEALLDPEVRARLAVAAARAGQPQEARQLLGALRRPSAAPAWLLCAAAAEAAGELGDAEDCAEAARESDPAHPEVAALSERLARRRADAQRPEEEAAEALLREGALPEAAERARLVLRRHPGSVAARRVLRAVEDREHEARARELLRSAERLQEAEPGRALTLVEEALGIGAGGALRARLGALQGELRARLQREERARRIGQARALLLDDPAAGLLAYQGLAPEERADVRAALGAGEAARLLGHADDILAARRGAPERAVAEAALALQGALRLLQAEEDPAAVIALLTPHGRLLDPLPAAQQALRRARARIEDREREAARARARALLAEAARADSAAAALEHLGHIDERLLSEEERAALGARREELSPRAERERVLLRVQAALRRLDVNEARDACMRLRELSPGERERRQPALYEGIIDLAFSVRHDRVALDNPGPPHELGDLLLERDAAHRGAQQWLTADGELVLADHCPPAVFVRVVDPESGAVLRRGSVSLAAAGEPMGALDRVQVEHHAIFLHFTCGGLLVLEPQYFSVRRFYPGAGLRPAIGKGPEATLESRDASVVGMRYLWQSYYRRERMSIGGGRPHRVVVTDLAHPRDRRVIDGEVAHVAAPGVERPVLTCAEGSAVSLRGSRGDLLRTAEPIQGVTIVDAALYPGQPALLLLCRDDGRGLPEAEQRRAGLATLVVMGEAPAFELRLDGVTAQRDLGLVSLPERGRVLARCHRARPPDEPVMGGAEVRGYDVPAGEGDGGPAAEGAPLLRERFRGDVPDETVLAYDAGLRRCYALAMSEEGLSIAPADGDGPPRLRGVASPYKIRENPAQVALCAQRLDPHLLVDMMTGADLLGHPRLEDRVAALLRMARQRPAGGGAAGAMLVAESSFNPELVKALGRALRAEGPVARFWVGHSYAFRRRWAEAESWLAEVDPADLPDLGRRRHLHHLRAVAALWRGERARAEAEVAAWRRLGEGDCPLGVLPELVSEAPLQGPAPPDDCDGRAAARRLRALVEEADGRVARGDAAGALRLLDCPLVWRARELQSMARLLEASASAGGQGNAAEPWRWMRAFHIFHALVHDPKEQTVELPYPGHTWPRTKIRALDEMLLEVWRRTSLDHRKAVFETLREQVGQLEAAGGATPAEAARLLADLEEGLLRDPLPEPPEEPLKKLRALLAGE